jgi:hypothetical protein
MRLNTEYRPLSLSPIGVVFAHLTAFIRLLQSCHQPNQKHPESWNKWNWMSDATLSVSLLLSTVEADRAKVSERVSPSRRNFLDTIKPLNQPSPTSLPHLSTSAL